MIDRTELLRMIMDNNPGQAPAYILEQYKQYVDSLCCTGLPILPVQEQQSLALPSAKRRTSITCGYTKRSLIVKPGESITDDAIFCCICGKKLQTLTERHLAQHNGLSKDGYLKLCGLPKDQVLMSRKYLAKMKSNVLNAQKARRIYVNPPND